MIFLYPLDPATGQVSADLADEARAVAKLGHTVLPVNIEAIHSLTGKPVAPWPAQASNRAVYRGPSLTPAARDTLAHEIGLKNLELSALDLGISAPGLLS